MRGSKFQQTITDYPSDCVQFQLLYLYRKDFLKNIKHIYFIIFCVKSQELLANCINFLRCKIMYINKILTSVICYDTIKLRIMKELLGVRTETAKIGFIGAGKCGMSLARYFRKNGLSVSGFASRHEVPDSGFEFFSKEDLVRKSDVLFICVTDSAITEVWAELRGLLLDDKIICHTSGSADSEIFMGADRANAGSIHPMLAFNSRETSHEAIESAFFTIEGGERFKASAEYILNTCNNRYKIIDKSCKAEYHAAACFASNFVVAVCEKAEQHLMSCGFSRDEAHAALTPLMRNNMDNIIAAGTHAAITGPAARGDVITLEKHRVVLGEDVPLYDMLTHVITDMM